MNTSHPSLRINVFSFPWNTSISHMNVQQGKGQKKLNQTNDLQRINNKKTNKKEIYFWTESMILGFETATSY
jgi:hypothetical protein